MPIFNEMPPRKRNGSPYSVYLEILSGPNRNQLLEAFGKKPCCETSFTIEQLGKVTFYFESMSRIDHDGDGRWYGNYCLEGDLRSDGINCRAGVHWNGIAGMIGFDPPIKSQFFDVYELVEKSNEIVSGSHDIHHALRVAHWAEVIALKEWRDISVARLAALAGLCHNADRILEKKHGRWQTPDNATEELVLSWLKTSKLTDEDKKVVLDAIKKHGGKNDPNASKVQIALMDADRVVNLELDLIIRSGQFYHDLPPVDYVHFLDDGTATYKEPKSCLRDIAYSLEWIDPNSPFCVVTKTGLELAQERAKHFSLFIETIKSQLKKYSL